MAFELRERVRWADVDAAGIIYFGAYVRLIEVAETELYRELGFPWGELFERFDIWLPRVHIDMNFRAPARLDDLLLLRTQVRGVGASSVRMAIALHRERDYVLLAEISVVTACVDRSSEKSRRLPQALGDALRAHIEEAS